jgi:hypothetical protein
MFYISDSTVGVMTGYGLDEGGIEVESQYKGEDFCLLHNIQNIYGGHPTMCTWYSFSGVKASGV